MPNTNEAAKGKKTKPLYELKISPAPWTVVDSYQFPKGGEWVSVIEASNKAGVSLWNCLKFRLRIEAAHKREIAAKDAEIEKLTFEIMKLKSEQRTAGEVIIEQTNKVEAKDAEIAELREYLKDAASLRCGECWFTAHEGKCPHSLDKDCVAITWRKASEGTNDEQH